MITAALRSPQPGRSAARDHVAQVSTRQPQHYFGTGPHIAVIDYGCKRGIVGSLYGNAAALFTIFPYDATAAQILWRRSLRAWCSLTVPRPRDLPEALPVISAL